MIRILRNEATEGEKEFFEAWLEESEDHKEEFASIALVWDRMAQAEVPPEPDADQLWTRIHERINTAPAPQPITPLPVRQPSKASRTFIDHFAELLSPVRSRPAKYAFAFGVVAALGFGIYALHRDLLVKQPVQVAQEPEPGDMMQEVITTRGERATVSLVDGSTVYLNAESKLRIPRTFGAFAREVELDGEGYFAVKPDAARPFRVSTGVTFTEVKGTEFNVRYRNDNLRVVVSRGAVQLTDRKRRSSVDLKKGELTSHVDATGFTPPRKVDVKMYTAWRENKLAFAKTPLADVMSEIELAYNITVVVKNKRAFSHTLTGYFMRDSLDEVLSTIALAMDVKIKRDGHIVTVY